jgi:hypothetical protein
MARPRKEKTKKHSHRLVARVTEAEYLRFAAEAKAAQITLSEYVRLMVTEGKVVVRRESPYGLVLAREIKSVGVNLNQLMPIAHLRGSIPSDLTNIISKLEVVLDRIIENV